MKHQRFSVLLVLYAVVLVATMPAPGVAYANNEYDAVVIATGDDAATYLIAENHIDMGDNPDAWGIVAYTTHRNATTIAENSIHVDAEGAAGIFLPYSVSGALVRENQIQGNGLYTIGFESWGSEVAGNRIVENQVEGFHSLMADYYLGVGVQDNMLFIGHDDTVIDWSGNETNLIVRDD
jgi:hypothetical protein